MGRKFMILGIVLAFLMAFAMNAYADVTTSDTWHSGWSNKKVRSVTIAFDSSYASSGETLTAAGLGMVKIQRAIIEPKDGYSFEYDYTNGKVKVLGNAPPIVYEEQHTATASSGITLDYPAAWIMSVVDSSGNPCQWVYSGATTLSTNQFATQGLMTKGERTGVTVDAADTYYISYITQAWEDIWNLLVQNQAIQFAGSGASAAVTGSGNTIMAFGCARAGATTYTPVDFYDTPLATEVGVDFGISGTSGSFLRTAVHTNTPTTVWVTYLKHAAPATWLKDRFLSGVSFDATSGSADVGSGVSYVAVAGLKGPILLWGVSGLAFSNGDTTQKLVRPSTAVSTVGYVKWNYANPTMTISNAANLTTPIYGYNFGDPSSGVTLTNSAFVWGRPYEIPNLKQIEVPNGRDLSGLTGVKATFIGY